MDEGITPSCVGKTRPSSCAYCVYPWDVACWWRAEASPVIGGKSRGSSATSSPLFVFFAPPREA